MYNHITMNNRSPCPFIKLFTVFCVSHNRLNPLKLIQINPLRSNHKLCHHMAGPVTCCSPTMWLSDAGHVKVFSWYDVHSLCGPVTYCGLLLCRLAMWDTCLGRGQAGGGLWRSDYEGRHIDSLLGLFPPSSPSPLLPNAILQSP